MRAAEDGLPQTEDTGRYLSVRPGADILVDEERFVQPGTDGMSVVPPPVTNLARHRLPREFGGTGRDSVFELDTGRLYEELTFRPDPANPAGHGFIEPSRRMRFEEYQSAIHGTRELWRQLR